MKVTPTGHLKPFALVLLGLTTVATIGGEPPDKPPEALGPAWQVGDRWTVRAVAVQSQLATETGEPTQQPKKPMDWKFTVVGKEEIKGRPCYRVAVTCLGRQHPITTIWCDAIHHTLIRVEAKVLIRGQWRVFTETYLPTAGTPCPVLGPLPALPLDVPVFTPDGRTKDLASQTYETIYGNAGTKAIGDVGFAFSVDQSVTPVQAEYVKSLVPESEAKGVVEVEIRGAGRRVSQLWEASAPWPIYSNNGMTEARLVEVTRAGEEEVQP
jgi:hypothetical protein